MLLIPIQHIAGKLLLVLILAFAHQAIALGQGKDGSNRAAQKAYEQGQSEIGNGRLAEAEKFLLKAIEQDPGWIKPRVTLAALYFEKTQWDQSRQYFESALAIDSLSEPIIHFKLGEIAWINHHYPEVKSRMEKVLSIARLKPSVLQMAEKYKRDAGFLMNNPPVYQTAIKPLPPTINTEAMEYLPSFPAREDVMIFTRRVRGQEDFYLSALKDGQWQEGVPVADLNTSQNEGAHCLSADGKMLIFTACDRSDGLGSCDLYYSVVDGKRWTKPANLGPGVNSRNWDGQPSFSANGRTLYFASERPGGRGGRDLWMINRKGSGWDNPQNLAPLNTSGNEEVPFIHAADQHLYFMSDGHPGFGGTDLFVSQFSADGWQAPRNLGAPINTSGDEGALHINLSGSTGYFARAVYEASKSDRGQIDIFEFEVPQAIRPLPATYASIRVLDQITRQPVRAILEIINLTTGKTFIRTLGDQHGELLVCLPAGEEFALNISKDQYAFHSEHIQVDQHSTLMDPREFQVLLAPIAESIADPTMTEPIVLNNIFFESGSAKLLEKSLYELQKLFDLLRDNVSMHIEIRGHTDAVGSETDNQELSEQRARAILDHLIAAGIPEERLTYRGFGESLPVADNDSEEGRQRNRRTEFIIISNEKK